MADEDILQLCFEKTAAERAALPAVDQINLDMESAYATAIASLPAIRAITTEIAGVLAKFDLSKLDKVEDYACAMKHAHHVVVVADAPAGSIVELNAEASALRDRFLLTAQFFAKLGVVSPVRLSDVTGRVGYKNVADDLDKLSLVLRDSWSAIEGKSPLTKEEIEKGRVLGKKLADAAAKRDKAPAVAGPALDDRARAFTLFVRTWDEIRAAVQYVRHKQGDADRIAPSLYAGRNTHPKKEEPSNDAPSPTAPTPAAPRAEVGMPGASPFVSA